MNIMKRNALMVLLLSWLFTLPMCLYAQETRIQLAIENEKITTEKVYDQTLGVEYVRGNVIGISSDYPDVRVNPTVVYDSIYASDNRQIIVTYTLLGKDADHYITPASKTLNGKITKKQLSVQVAPDYQHNKTYDGTTDIVIYNPPVFGGIFTSDQVSVSTKLSYPQANVGVDYLLDVLFTLSGADMRNYEVPTADDWYASITAKSLHITKTSSVAESKVYDGTDSCTLISKGQLIPSEIISGDQVQLEANARYEDDNVGSGKLVKVTYVLSGIDANNYSAPTSDTLKADITHRPLRVVPTVALSKEYDGTTSVAASVEEGQVYNLISGDVVSINVSATYDNKMVGSGKNIVVTYTHTGADAANYLCPADTVLNTGIIETRHTFIADSTVITKDKVYDGTDTIHVIYAGALGNIISGDNVKVTAEAHYFYGGQCSFDARDSLTIKVKYILTGLDVSNYDTPQPLVTSGSIMRKPLSIDPEYPTIVADTVYNGSTRAGISFVGKLQGVLEPDLNYVSLLATANYRDPNVQPAKVVDISYDITGLKAGNYIEPNDVASQAAITPLQMVINTKPVVQSVKQYDATTLATVVRIDSVANIIGDDQVFIKATASYDTKDIASDKDVYVVYTLSGNDVSNYLAPAADTLHGNAIVGRELHISGTQVTSSKVYDGTTKADVVKVGITDVLSGDSIIVTATAAYDNKNAGNDKTITVTYNVSGPDSANYVVTEKHVVNECEIKERPLDIVDYAAVQTTKVYDASQSCAIVKEGQYKTDTMGFYHCLVPGDEVVLHSTALYVDSIPGYNKIVDIKYDLTGKDAANYSLTVPSHTTRADITKRQLFVSNTAVVVSKPFDGNNIATVTSPGTAYPLYGSDASSIVALTAVAYYDSSSVGNNKPITVSYRISSTAADCYITPADTIISTIGEIYLVTPSVTGTTIASSKAYDGTTMANVLDAGTMQGLQPGATDVQLLATAVYENQNIGKGKLVTVTYQLNGSDAQYYGVPVPYTTTADITRMPLVVSGTEVELIKTYDGTAAVQINDTGAISVIGVEDVKLSATATYDTKDAGENKTIRVTYAISGSDADNYLTPDQYVINNSIINPAPLTVFNLRVDTLKMYDGLTDATVVEMPSLEGVLPGEDVSITAEADFADASAGSNKIILAQFTLSGSDARNYQTPLTLVYTDKGRIFDEVLLNPDASDSSRCVKTGQSSYCEEDFIYLTYAIRQGDPYEYRIEFSNSAKQQGFEDISWTSYDSTDSVEAILVPEDCLDGTYTAVIQFRNELQSANNLPVTRRDTFDIRINLSQDYITDIFSDVISIVNVEERFHSYQWYKNNAPIPGATQPYYQEVGGLDGIYYVVVNEGEESENKVCPREFTRTQANASAEVRAYPNPVVDEVNVRLIAFPCGEHSLRVIDQTGISVLTELFSGESVTLSLSNLPAGNYTIFVDGKYVKVIKK